MICLKPVSVLIKNKANDNEFSFTLNFETPEQFIIESMVLSSMESLKPMFNNIGVDIEITKDFPTTDEIMEEL